MQTLQPSARNFISGFIIQADLIFRTASETRAKFIINFQLQRMHHLRLDDVKTAANTLIRDVPHPDVT